MVTSPFAAQYARKCSHPEPRDYGPGLSQSLPCTPCRGRPCGGLTREEGSVLDGAKPCKHPALPPTSVIPTLGLGDRMHSGQGPLGLNIKECSVTSCLSP